MDKHTSLFTLLDPWQTTPIDEDPTANQRVQILFRMSPLAAPPNDLPQQLKETLSAIPRARRGKLPKIFKQEERENNMTRCLWVVGCHFSFFRFMIPVMFVFLNKFIYLSIYFWLPWVFVAVHGPPLVVASGGYSSLRCAGFSLRWPLLLQSTGSRAQAQ